jgi:hypothetical protein
VFSFPFGSHVVPLTSQLSLIIISLRKATEERKKIENKLFDEICKYTFLKSYVKPFVNNSEIKKFLEKTLEKVKPPSRSGVYRSHLPLPPPRARRRCRRTLRGARRGRRYSLPGHHYGEPGVAR